MVAESGIRLPVLLYHYVGPLARNASRPLTLSTDQFERQICWLAHRGFIGISPADWLSWSRNGTHIPAKPILLTFDDAYADIAEYALPVLEHYGFSAAVFVVTGQIDGSDRWDLARGSDVKRLMTVTQIRQWAARGIEFGAHSRTHANLTNLTNKELTEEVVGSNKDLAGILGTRVISFAYPYGSYNEIVRDSVSRAFELAFTCEEGLNGFQTDFYRLRRTMVLRSDSLVDLSCRVYFGWSPIQQFRRHVRLRTRVKRAVQVLGNYAKRNITTVNHSR